MTPSPRPKIVAGIDGSEASLAALSWATGLAGQCDGSVAAVMAWNYPAVLMMPVVGAPVLLADEMADAARTNLESAIAANPSSIAEQWVVMGSARSVLTEASEDHDLLVIGRTGNRGFKRLLLGSTASYCVRHAECPVVVVRDAMTPETSIVVGIDGSRSSTEALVWALELGDHHDVLAVYSHDEWELDELPLQDRFRESLDAKADETLAATVQAALDRTGAAPDRVRRQVRQGDPRSTLVDQADPDTLLVLGAQGHSGIARWMLGSLADYAVNHAPGTVAIWR